MYLSGCNHRISTSLHLKKSLSLNILFARKPNFQLSLTPNNDYFTTTNSVKYLGVQIDKQLSFKCRVGSSQCRCDCKIVILSPICIFNYTTIFYYILTCYILYLLGHGLIHHIYLTAKVTKQALRFKRKSLLPDKTTPLFCKLKILKVQDLLTYEITKEITSILWKNYQFAINIILHIFKMFTPIPREIRPTLISIYHVTLPTKHKIV